jgi:hypothetical protein
MYKAVILPLAKEDILEDAIGTTNSKKDLVKGLQLKYVSMSILSGKTPKLQISVTKMYERPF